MAEHLDAEEIRALLDSLYNAGPGASVDVVLEGMGPDEARLLRLCAIPHVFDAEIMRVLEPSLEADDAARRCQEFAQLPIVSTHPDGLALQGNTRRHLFGLWLQPPNAPLFAQASERLWSYFNHPTGESPRRAEEVEFRGVFHLIGFSQEKGFVEFERLFAEKRRQFEYSKCERLIRLVREYGESLPLSYRDRLTYLEGKVCVDRRDVAGAVNAFSRLLARPGLDRTLGIKIHSKLGAVYSFAGKWESAAASYREALKLLRGVEGAESMTARVLNGLGVALDELGALEEAESRLSEGVKAAGRAKDGLLQSILLNSLGTLRRKAGDFDGAIEAYNQSLELLGATSDELRVSQVYNNLAIAYARKNDWKRSESLYNRSLNIKRKFGDLAGEARTLNNLARVYKNIGDYDHAIKSARMAVSKFGSVHEFKEMARAQWNLGKLCLEHGRRDESFKAYQGAIQVLARAGDSDEADKVGNQIRREMQTIFM